jgi:hypothetical protein
VSTSLLRHADDDNQTMATVSTFNVAAVFCPQASICHLPASPIVEEFRWFGTLSEKTKEFRSLRSSRLDRSLAVLGLRLGRDRYDDFATPGV